MKASVVLWYLIFGLLPFWGLLALVIAGSMNRSADYWFAAPWLIFLAIPLCAVTLVMARVTHAVYAKTEGGKEPKLKRSALTFIAMSAVVLGGIAFHALKEARVKADQEAGRVLVERSALVARAAPAGFRVVLNSSRFDRSGEPMSFYYHVSAMGSSPASLMAIVDVAGDRAGARLQLKCVIPTDAYHSLESGIDPCLSERAIVPG